MSVTMHLYKPNHSVDYVGYYLDFVPDSAFVLDKNGYYPLEKYEKELGAPMKEDGHWPTDPFEDPMYEAHQKWEEEQESKAWSDEEKHEMLNITHLKSCLGQTRGWRHIAKRFNTLSTKTFNNGKEIRKYITVDEIEYAQGWFFKKRFFKKELTWTICTTKEQMLNFFKQYVDLNHPKDKRGREAVERFTAAWEDGMIFECAW